MIERRTGPSDVTHTTLSVLFLGLLIGATFWVISPFLVPILWATIVTVTAWPAFLRLETLLGRRRGLAVALITVLVLLAVFVPVAGAVVTIIRNAQSITDELKSLQSISLPAPPSWIERIPIVGEKIVGQWKAFDALGPEERAAAVSPFLQEALQWFIAKAGSVGAMLLQFLLTTIISAVLFGNGEDVRDAILRFSRRLAGQQGYDTALLAGKAIRGVVLGVLGTALLQTTIAGLGLLVTGVPFAAFLTAVILILCLAQLGPLLVLVPVVVWLYWSDHVGAAIVLVVAALVSGTIDNVLRPLLIKRGVDMPLVFIFAGVIGGLVAFGIIGLFVGPVVLAVARTLLQAWIVEDA
jgi:predicted PurR-regulated permease PerM